MRLFFFFLIVFSLSSMASAQNTGLLKGKLMDSVSKQVLKDASITILDAKDSSLEVFTLAKGDGSFVLENIPFGEMILKISFQGYEPISKNLLFSKSNFQIDLGTIYLKIGAKDLGNVTVTQSVIQMKKDTMEISASAFKTKPNANAEDLLKKIPGMEVGKDGSVKSQGESVQRILVDGKRFFGDDPKMATKNLPPDVIDKIQVFDDLSDQSKFTGFDDGNRVKTINIQTKKDKRKGYFGRLVLGAGTDGNYDESLSVNRFNGGQQISFVGQANNINKQNFTQQNMGGGNRGGGSAGGFGGGGFGGGGFGGFGGGGGGGNRGGGASPVSNSSAGITTTLAGGVNYRDAWSDKIDVYGSYFYNHLNVASDQNSYTQNILNADSSTYNDRKSSSFTRTETHRLNFNFENRIDSNNQLLFRPNISFQNSNPSTSSSTISTGGKSGSPIYQSSTTNNSFSKGYNINGANLQYRHRFAKPYRTISLDFGFSASENIGDGFNYSINSFVVPFVKKDTINQYYMDTAKTFSVNPTISYTEPIGKNQVLEFKYSYSYSNNESTNRTSRFDPLTQKYSRFDSLFSNSYKFVQASNSANISYRYQNTKLNVNIGTGLQFTDLTSNNTTKNILVNRNFLNVTPSLNFTYNYTKTKNLRINYNGRTGQPSINQLQPILTTSDSINFQQGNPNLRPQFTNSLRILYTSFNPVNQHLLIATINASAIANDIQSSIAQKTNGGRTTTYVNLNGTYNVSAFFNYGFPLKKPKSNLSFQTNISYAQNQSLLNNISNFTYNSSLTETIKWTTNLSTGFDMNLSASGSYNIAKSSLQTSQNLNYFVQSLGAEFTFYNTKGFILSSEFEYAYNGNRLAGYNASVPLWNPSIAMQVFKNKSGEIRLSCFDLLNQNVNVSRTVSANQIIDTRTNTLTRYFMLTFTYNLRNFAGQGQQMPGMRGMFGPGMRPGGMSGMGNFGGNGIRRGN